MPFSPQVRREALVRAARHCCVCHRYKGVKVEVHHITPESEGGSSEIDNAIALCFDCHTDAGHYNPNHPRGVKFSPEELRQARDWWYTLVRGNRIEAPDLEDAVYSRYLLCRSFDAIREIAAGQLAKIPVPEPLLARTPPGEFLSQLVELQGNETRPEKIYGDLFSSTDAYATAHPNVRIFERSSMPYYPYFRAFRVPSEDEIRRRVAQSDVISRLLLNATTPAREICRALAYDELCGSRGFQELYRLRPLWGVYLEVRNIGELAIRLESVHGVVENPDGLGFRPFLITSNECRHIELPRPALLPGQSALIPLATVLGPLDRGVPDGVTASRQEFPTGQVQDVQHTDCVSLVPDLCVIGSAIWPKHLTLEAGGSQRQQPIHELDLSNLYVIDRYWEAGSCPHLFWVGSEGNKTYAGELFARAASVMQEETHLVPDGVCALLIAELEAEMTWIVFVKINERSVLNRRTLTRGQSLLITVEPRDRVFLRGWYEPESGTKLDPSPLFRDQTIRKFLEAQH